MNLWDLKSGWYSAIRRVPGFRRILDSEIESLKRLLSEFEIGIDRVVDIGTGAGDAWMLYPQIARGIGVDASFNMLVKTRSRFPGLILIVADVRALPFRKDAIPFLSMIGVAEYISDKMQLLSECARVVPIHGHLIMTLPAPGVFTSLRNVFGEKLFSISQAEWETCLQRTGWKVRGFRKTLLQRQYLLQRCNEKVKTHDN